ncbi:MAG: tryptophan--tRNA ligase [Gammaproteobacteria bacterium]
MSSPQNQRVLSGMRTTGLLHLGHYEGVLKNWLKLQHEYECFFFAADWHALTTHYENPQVIEDSVWEMIIDWLSVGINPSFCKIFIQSRVPQHAELHLLLSMITPLGWLERVPTYKDQQEKLKELDLATYGFLGYPLLQSADILLYKAGFVPVGEDQVVHVEMTREIARRFNHLYGKEPGFEQAAEAAIEKMGKKNAKLYMNLRKRYQEHGDQEALGMALELVNNQQNISLGDRERLEGYLHGGGKMILTEPEVLLTEQCRLPGLDGQKMSKSYHNYIGLRDDTDTVAQKIRKMPTDPARVRRTDPGEPSKCPVWEFHRVYSDAKTQQWVEEGCRSAGIGCLECKQPIIDVIEQQLQPIRENAKQYQENPDVVRNIVNEGCSAARDVAEETMREVREAMRLDY